MTTHLSPRSAVTRAAGQLHPNTPRRRRSIEVVAFVGIWAAAGYLLSIDANGYLLLGIPLTLGFQVLVRRRPIRELFAANTSRFALDSRGIAIAAVVAVVPAYHAVQVLAGGGPTLLGWYLAALAGAIWAAYSLRASSVRAALRSAALPIAVGAGGMALVYGIVHIATATPLPAVVAVAALVKYAAPYFPATFLLEEVTFRGALDAHVNHDGDGRGWLSAIFVSALWGLWHIPVAGGLPLFAAPGGAGRRARPARGAVVVRLAPNPRSGRTGAGPRRHRRRP
jgi:hypothetical protein